MQNEDNEHIREKLLESTEWVKRCKSCSFGIGRFPVAGSIIGASVTACTD